MVPVRTSLNIDPTTEAFYVKVTKNPAVPAVAGQEYIAKTVTRVLTAEAITAFDFNLLPTTANGKKKIVDVIFVPGSTQYEIGTTSLSARPNTDAITQLTEAANADAAAAPQDKKVGAKGFWDNNIVDIATVTVPTAPTSTIGGSKNKSKKYKKAGKKHKRKTINQFQKINADIFEYK